MFQKKDGVHFVQLEERRQPSKHLILGGKKVKGKCLCVWFFFVSAPEQKAYLRYCDHTFSIVRPSSIHR